jgi:hypothetical protein
MKKHAQRAHMAVQGLRMGAVCQFVSATCRARPWLVRM